jgi:hypothetical protein
MRATNLVVAIIFLGIGFAIGYFCAGNDEDRVSIGFKTGGVLAVLSLVCAALFLN